jgi:hypothetical protein
MVGRKMRLYFDTCSWNRPYDDQRQAKIRAESTAVKNVIALAQWNGYAIFGSKMLDKEIGNIKDPQKHGLVWKFYQNTITERVTAKKAIFDRFAPLALQAGISRSDAVHLCYSISAGANYLLTTDDDFIDIAAGLAIPTKVTNPLNFPLGGII